jgi:hypothetical protein
MVVRASGRTNQTDRPADARAADKEEEQIRGALCHLLQRFVSPAQ